eukprot:360207-Chlamydomonas_euryale.AAC.19
MRSIPPRCPRAQAAPQPHAPQQQVLRGGVWPAHLGGHVNGPAVRVAHQPDGGDCADRAPDTGQPPDSHAQVHQDLVAAGAERPVGPDTGESTGTARGLHVRPACESTGTARGLHVRPACESTGTARGLHVRPACESTGLA